MNDTIQPIRYNWTEKICSTLLRVLSEDVKLKISKKKKANTKDITKLSINQNSSLKIIVFIYFVLWFFKCIIPF